MEISDLESMHIRNMADRRVLFPLLDVVNRIGEEIGTSYGIKPPVMFPINYKVSMPEETRIHLIITDIGIRLPWLFS